MTSAGIHIVDDDPDIRDGLAWLFDSRGYRAQTWANGLEFLESTLSQSAEWGISVVLMDIRMEHLSGLSTFEKLKEIGCPWPVLFLTGHGDVGMAVAAVKNGAWDFLEKPFQDNLLVDRVEQAIIMATERQQSSEQYRKLKTALASLSNREREVLGELLRGNYNKNIADHLGITPRTVEFHRANIFEKLGVHSAVELAHQMGKLQATESGPHTEYDRESDVTKNPKAPIP